MATLERAIAIAAEAHAGQTDKAGAAYILHPLRVMLSVSRAEDQIATVLHDVLEDCPAWPLERLRAEGFGEAVLVALVALARRPGETYEDFITRAGEDPIARRVKLADLADNSNLARIGAPTPDDHARLEKYRRATLALTA